MSVKKIPSYLKGLAVRHARTQAEIQSLKTTIEVATLRAAHHSHLAQEATQELRAQTEKLQCLELLIKDYNNLLDTSKIDPVLAWKGRYGKRGQMQDDILMMIRQSESVGLPASYVYEVFAERLGWPLEGPEARRLAQNRIGPALQRLRDKRQISNVSEGGVSRWVAVEFLPQP